MPDSLVVDLTVTHESTGGEEVAFGIVETRKHLELQHVTDVTGDRQDTVQTTFLEVETRELVPIVERARDTRDGARPGMQTSGVPGGLVRRRRV